MADDSKVLVVSSDQGTRTQLVTFDEVSRAAGAFAKSGFFKDSTDAAQAIVKILAGQELGIGAVAAMRGISFIMGKLNVDAGLVSALIKRSGRYDYHIKTHTEKECTIEFFDRGTSIGRSTFTEVDAKAAGLLGKDLWQKYPKNMYFARALSNGAKWYTPDVFYGSVYTGDELDDTPVTSEAIPEAKPAGPEGRVVESVQQPTAQTEPPMDDVGLEEPEGRPTHPQFKDRTEFMALVVKWLPRYRSAADPTQANDFAVLAHLRKENIPSWARPDAWTSLCKSNDDHEGKAA